MSKHWQPGGKIVRIRPAGRWARAGAYVPASAPARGSGGTLPVLLGAAFLGLLIGVGPLVWTNRVPTVTGPDKPIDWNGVQAAPTSEVTAEDIDWQARAAGPAQDGGSASSGRARGAIGYRASFGFCHAGGGRNCFVDGDTFYIGGEKVRIAGIDTPETHPPRCASEARLGAEATERLRALLNSGEVTMSPSDRDRDRYGRLLRDVAVDGHDVGEEMIGLGVARPYRSGRRSWC